MTATLPIRTLLCFLNTQMTIWHLTFYFGLFAFILSNVYPLSRRICFFDFFHKRFFIKLWKSFKSSDVLRQKITLLYIKKWSFLSKMWCSFEFLDPENLYENFFPIGNGTIFCRLHNKRVFSQEKFSWGLLFYFLETVWQKNKKTIDWWGGTWQQILPGPVKRQIP